MDMKLVKGKTYRWKYVPAGSKFVREETGRFTGEYDDLYGMARMVQDIDMGNGRTVEGYILANPHDLEEVNNV